jgi:hypothetical protein
MNDPFLSFVHWDMCRMEWTGIRSPDSPETLSVALFGKSSNLKIFKIWKMKIENRKTKDRKKRKTKRKSTENQETGPEESRSFPKPEKIKLIGMYWAGPLRECSDGWGTLGRLRSV